MPIDPATGERLPYAGEPKPGAPPAPEGELPAEIIPERDIKPIADEVDRILAAEAEAEGELGPEGEAAGEAVTDAAADADVTPIAEKLGVDIDKARELYEAAQAMPVTQGLSPDELADKLIDDLDLRMKLEKLAAGEMEKEEMDQLVAASMPEAGAPPAGAPPAGGPLPVM